MLCLMGAILLVCCVGSLDENLLSFKENTVGKIFKGEKLVNTHNSNNSPSNIL